MINLEKPSDVKKNLLTKDSRVMKSSSTGKVFLMEGYKVVAHLEWAKDTDLKTIRQIILDTVN